MSAQLITALQDCVSVMERDLNGLAVIQPELKQAREVLASLTTAPEWNGEGLPPVGLQVEWRSSVECDWARVTVRGYANGEAWIEPEKGQSFIVGNPAGFRPIRTPKQIAADEREKAARQMSELTQGAHNWMEAFGMLHDAGYRKVEGGAQ